MWIRGLKGEKLPAASYALLPNLKKGTSICFAIREGSRLLVLCFLHISAQMCLYQTPGRRPPSITGCVANTATRGWVAAPNERAPFRFDDAVVGFRCLLSTRNLAFSHQTFGWAFPRLILAQHRPGFSHSTFSKVRTFLSRFLLMASSTEILWRVYLIFKDFWATSRFH